jgi:rod shape-determining protein MreB
MTLAESLLSNSTQRSLVQETLRREIPNFGRSYQQRVIEPQRRNVDPSVDAAVRIQDAVVAEKNESRTTWNFAANSWSKIAIDLGTSYTRIFVNGRGIILNEPSLICLEENTGKIIALGLEAKSMAGRAHSGINILSPLESSAITDYTDVKRMVMEFIRQAKRSAILIRPGVILTIQPGLTSLEKRAFLDFIKELGAREVHLVYQPLAAAIGAGLPVDVPRANMVVNIGGGSITAIVISVSGIVAMASDKVGGKMLDTHLIRYLRENHNFCIGDQTAEWIKINHGQAIKTGRDYKIEIRGQDIIMGIPDTLSVSTSEIRDALAKPVARMIDVIRDLLERVPPELSADLVDRGMTLTGGGSLLAGLDSLIKEKTGISTRIAPNALTATVEGAGRMLSDFQSFNRFFVQDFAVQDK